MAKIILVNGINPLSVKLQFDLLLHGKACRAFTDGKAQLKIIENALCEAVVDNHIDLLHAKRADAEHSLLVAEKNLRHERDTLSVELTALSGSLHWLTIKRMLSNQCNHNNPLEKELSSSLTMSEPSEMAPPLAIESLDHSFNAILL